MKSPHSSNALSVEHSEQYGQNMIAHTLPHHFNKQNQTNTNRLNANVPKLPIHHAGQYT